MLNRLIKYISLDSDFENKPRYYIFLIPFSVALIVRVIYHFLDIPDFWGDSYHSMYMSWATIENNWIYSDYKGREVVWLPFYRYLSTFLLFIFQREDLLIPHVFNMILGSITCGVVAVFTAKLSTARTGILAGVVLALSAWHTAYSHMNMSEITALFLLVMALQVWVKQQYLWLIPIGFAGVLTRNEITLLLAVFGVVLLLKKDWKASIYLFVGSVTGLGLWGWWNVIKRNEFFWWIASRSRGNSWDRFLVIAQGQYLNDWYIQLAVFVSVLPIVLILIFYLKPFRRAISKIPFKNSGAVLAVFAILLFHWLYLMIMQTEYFSAPNGRFWLPTLPLACVCFGIMVFYLDKKYRNQIIGLSTSLCFIFLLFMGFVLYQQHKIYAFNMELGQHIRKTIPKAINLWIDFPDILFFSEIDYSRAYSSDQIMPMESRYIPDDEKVLFLTGRFETLKIGYLISSPVSYSIVLGLWPQMKKLEAFKWGPYKFTPVFSKFNTKDQIVGPPMASWMRYVGGVNKKSVLWKIDKQAVVQ